MATMKLRCRLCFLVLAISSFSRGEKTSSSLDKDLNATQAASTQAWTTKMNQIETKNETTSPTPTTQPSQTSITANTTAEDVTNKTSEGGQQSTALPNETRQVSTSTPFTPGTTASAEASSGGAVLKIILVLIILLIIVLCVILYFLRRINRSYSFDLQRPPPSSHLNEPIGVFEHVYLDDLDRPAPKDTMIADDLSISPTANGTNGQSEDKVSNGENAAQEQPDANGVRNSPTSSTSSSSTDAQAEKTPEPLSMNDLLFDAVVGEQNENNNNPSVAPSGPFVEINLDEPAWCDQLLTSPQASSSVLPFSPFSFSSSSSISS